MPLKLKDSWTKDIFELFSDSWQLPRTSMPSSRTNDDEMLDLVVAFGTIAMNHLRFFSRVLMFERADSRYHVFDGVNYRDWVAILASLVDASPYPILGTIQ